MSTVDVIARVVLAAVFITAGVGKLIDLDGSRKAMRDFGVPESVADAFGLLLPIAELVIAVTLIFRPTAQWAALAAFVLLLAFIAGIANAMRKGEAPDCHCFGQIRSEPAGRGTLIRNGVLAVIALIVLIDGGGPAIDTWVRGRSTGTAVGILAAIVAVALAVAFWQQRKKNAQLTQRLAQAEANQRNKIAPGAPVGTPAPETPLRNLDDMPVSLAELRRGRPQLLVFVSPGCGSCQELYPDLRRWQLGLQERIAVTLISGGHTEDNLYMREEHGLDDVLLQDNTEFVDAWHIRGTPTAILLDPDGRVASGPAESVFAIEPLVRAVLHGGNVAPVSVDDSIASV
jgi:uncharacterized membrane protein YphA (DoxX/SURF4 family)